MLMDCALCFLSPLLHFIGQHLSLCDVSARTHARNFVFTSECEVEERELRFFFLFRIHPFNLPFLTCMHNNSTTVRAQTVFGHRLIQSE